MKVQRVLAKKGREVSWRGRETREGNKTKIYHTHIRKYHYETTITLR